MSELVSLVERSIELTSGSDRTDLRQRLQQTRARLLDPDIRVMVVGEFKQGKSKLINALVGAPVCPVGDDVATSVPTVVRYGEEPSATLIFPAEGAVDPSPLTGADRVDRRSIPLDELAAHVSEKGNPHNSRHLVAAEAYLPRRILAGGLCLIDSPGVGGLGSSHSLSTLTALATADAVLLVSDASQEYTEPEMQFLDHARRMTPHLACVVTKTDLYPEWRRIAELDREHLDRVSRAIPLFAVSSDLRLHAGRENDDELNAESGFPALVHHLRANILGRSEAIHRRAACQDVAFVMDHLALALDAELSALEDPTGAQRVVAEMEAAKQRANDLRQKSARWQITLNDGIGDLISDMEYDLRDRLRSVQRDAELAIDEGDPGKEWDAFVDWIEQRISAAISDTFVWTNERTQWLSGEVAAHFAEQDVSLPVLRVDSTDDLLDAVDFMPELEPGHIGPVEKLLIGMRGSYGGVLMVGLITGIMGLALINPLSIAAGVLIGAKVYRDDKDARLKRRRADAKALVRRQVDEVIFQVGKQLKDRLRLVQRGTRDHFTKIADEYHRSLAESAAAVQVAATTRSAEGQTRIPELKSRLAEVRGVQSEARRLARGEAPATRPTPLAVIPEPKSAARPAGVGA
jgi:hypothetical protein